MNREEIIQQYRDVADYLEAHPKAYASPIALYHMQPDTKEAFRDCIEGAGILKKAQAWGGGLRLVGKIGANVDLNIWAPRDKMCKRTVVKVTRLEKVPVEFEEREVEYEEERWECPESILEEVVNE